MSVALVLCSVVLLTPYVQAESYTLEQVDTTTNAPAAADEAQTDSDAMTELTGAQTYESSAVNDQPETTTEQQSQVMTEQTASSGTVDIQHSDAIGASASGDSTNDADILNMSNVYQNISNTSPVVFITTVEGNQTGDIIVDPYALGMPKPTSETIPASLDSDTQIDVNNLLYADVVQTSNSGNVLLASNESVDTVTTGDASNSLDMINVANTVIGTGSFFVGIINIFGDFQGNILLPAELLQQYSDTASYTAVPLSTIVNESYVENDVSMDAQSGSIRAEQNDTIGELETGSATNSLLVQTYTGQYVLYENAFLILVHMGGQWYGYIYENPYLSTSAGLTTADTNLGTPAPPNSINVSTGIYNSLTMTARSGDIELYDNDAVSSGTTGNASNSARILNVANTFVSFSNWFGVLIVNVLGDWFGTVQAIPSTDSNQPTSPPNVQTSAQADRSATPSKVRLLIWDIRTENLYGFTEWLGLTNPEDAGSRTATMTEPVAEDDMFPLANGLNLAAAPETSALRWLTLALFMTASLYSGHRLYALRQLG